MISIHMEHTFCAWNDILHGKKKKNIFRLKIYKQSTTQVNKIF